MTIATTDRRRIELAGIDIELALHGQGRPLLLLSSEEQLEQDLPLITDLARRHQVIVPSAPGFGRSDRPDWISNPDDIAYLYLELLDKLDLSGIAAVGFSLGGWIATEMATKSPTAFSKLALVSAYGIKFGGPYDVDIQDVWTSHPDKVTAWKWHDADKGKRDFLSMDDEALGVVARNTESFARFCWDPYMHNPKLKRRLHRIKAPTLVIWGENDGLTSPVYGKAYADLIPGARFESIAAAGHYPHVEQPDAFGKILHSFLD